MAVRHTAVAGSFYPGEAKEISHLLDKILLNEKGNINKEFTPKKIIGGIVPHAGYSYSANEAVHFFHFLKESGQNIDTFIIINPSHFGASEDISFDTHEAWNTPLGDIELDIEFMDFIDIPKVLDAQIGEHAAEVNFSG